MQGFKKFQDGLNRVVVVAGERAGRGLELYADRSTRNMNQRALIVADLSFSLDDLMTQIGSVHASGQVTVPEIHVLGKGCFPGDEIRCLQFWSRLKDLGATMEEVEMDSDIGSDLSAASSLHVILKVLDHVYERNTNIHDWLSILGNGFKIGPTEQVYDTKKATFSSQAAVSALLSRSLRLPLDVQKLIFVEICHGVKLRMGNVDTSGWLRGTNCYDYIINDCCRI